MTQPLVSIIILCYNTEAFVGEAIESVLAQTYPNVEVIVIDGGSTDGSLEVVRSFGVRMRWKMVTNQRVCGVHIRNLDQAVVPV